jgi:hypothetical protein
LIFEQSHQTKKFFSDVEYTPDIVSEHRSTPVAKPPIPSAAVQIASPHADVIQSPPEEEYVPASPYDDVIDELERSSNLAFRYLTS